MRNTLALVLFLLVNALLPGPVAALAKAPLPTPLASFANGGEGEDGEPQFDCPLVDFVMTYGTPVPEDQQEEMQELLESLGYPNSAAYTFGSTIVIITVYTFTACPMVTVL